MKRSHYQMYRAAYYKNVVSTNTKFKAQMSVFWIFVFTVIAVIVALILQDICNWQPSIAKASDDINAYKITHLAELEAGASAENKMWQEQFEQEVAKTFTAKKAEDWEAFKLMARSIAPIYDYPPQVLISQAALESARGTSRWAIERNNYFGYTCYDGREEASCAYFSSPYESIIEYVRLIKNKYPKAYAVRHNPDLMIREIKAAGYASDPNYVFKLSSMKEFLER